MIGFISFDEVEPASLNIVRINPRSVCLYIHHNLERRAVVDFDTTVENLPVGTAE
jgi:hypothetical protein